MPPARLALHVFPRVGSGVSPTRETPGRRMGDAAGRSYGRSMRERLRRLPWKKLLAGGAAVAVLLVALAAGAGAWVWSRAKVSTVGDLDFANALQIPPLAEPTIAPDGTKVFDLRFTAGRDRPRRRRAQRDVGAQRHLPRPDPAGRTRATTCA